MNQVKVSVLWVPGTNCHQETMYAFRRVGTCPELVLLSQLLEGTRKLDECDILALSGGFSFGDDIAAGRIVALDLTRRFADQLKRVVAKKIPVIGICNGFQEMVEAGLLPGDGEIGCPTAAMDFNLTARFEHWTKVKVVLHEPAGINCVWTKGLDGMTIVMPSAHGQGVLVAPNGPSSYHVTATYGTYEGDDRYIGGGGSSPNGSKIAAIGTEFMYGGMPHPERAGEAGLPIFEAGVNSVR